MCKKIILVLLGIFLFFGYKIAKAEVIINEIMYAPASGDSEWIEIFNSGSNSVDLTDWRFFNNVDDSSPLRLQKGSAILAPGGYALITSVADANSFSGTVFSSSQFSLPNDSSKYNTYKAISDSNKQNISSVTYTTSGDTLGTGNSLQLINGEWKSATRTPNAQNYASLNVVPQNSPSVTGLPSTSSSSQNTTETKTKMTEILKIKTKIKTKNLAFIGIPTEFELNATGYSNEPLFYGKYFLNFGDGDSKEIKANEATKFTHTFFYEGEYDVTLEYYQNYYSDNPDASDTTTIKVVPINISISNIGDENDFFVEISNDTSYDADISRWVLMSDQKSFTLPKNTILQSKKKIILSPKITGFSVSDKDTLRLLNKDGEIVFDYSYPIKPVKILSRNSTQTKVSVSDSAGGTDLVLASENDTQTEVPANGLGAEIIKSDASGGGDSNFKYGIFGLFVFLGVGAGGAYFIRNYSRKITTEENGNDFEIIDE